MPLSYFDPLGLDYCSGNSSYTTGGGSTNGLPVDCGPGNQSVPTTPDPCYLAGLCPGSSGVPNIYEASYNGPVPSGQYFQGLTWQSVDSFVGQHPGAEYVEYTPLPIGLLNFNSNQGYQGGGELELGFKLLLNALLKDVQDGILPPESQPILKGWQTATGGPSLKANLAGSCSSLASQVMSRWKKLLQAWLQTHPGQPPPEVANPPSLPACSI